MPPSLLCSGAKDEHKAPKQQCTCTIEVPSVRGHRATELQGLCCASQICT